MKYTDHTMRAKGYLSTSHIITVVQSDGMSMLRDDGKSCKTYQLINESTVKIQNWIMKKRSANIKHAGVAYVSDNPYARSSISSSSSVGFADSFA